MPQNNAIRFSRLSCRYFDNPTFFLKPDPIGDAADKKNGEQSRQSSHRVVAACRYESRIKHNHKMLAGSPITRRTCLWRRCLWSTCCHQDKSMLPPLKMIFSKSFFRYGGEILLLSESASARHFVSQKSTEEGGVEREGSGRGGNVERAPRGFRGDGARY